MEVTLNGPVIPRLSFVSAVELSPRTGPVDASDIRKNLYGDFSSISDTSQRESLESKERIHVCLRIRPFMPLEKESDSQDCISVLDPTSVILKAPKSSNVFRLSEKNLGQLVQKFTFSQVFGPETTQEELFDGAVKQPVLDFLKGHSHLIFTYGVTNAGKTYTYQGTEEASGILPRSLDLLFNHLSGKLYPGMDLKPHRCREHRRLSKEEVREETSVKNSLLRLMKETDYQTSIHGNYSKTTDKSEDLTEPVNEAEQSYSDEKKGVKFSVWVSFCEIYNECIYDLLLPVSADKKRKMLRLAQDVNGCSYVKDLQWIQVSNSKEAFKLMRLGLKHQSSASTKLNANSSRSHSIFNVKMLKIDSEVSRVMRVNELFLCDLAGSERCTRTHNEGDRLKESGNINTSLLILGKCINALKTSQQSKLQQHIPFRESKLTHYFQGFFSGKGKVCMIVNVSQSAAAYDETLNVLKFSAIAQKVLVLDSSKSLQGETLDEISVKAESEMRVEDLPIKRATILWERTLEDVMEDEEELLKEGVNGDEGNGSMENFCMKEGEGDIAEGTTSQVEEEESDILIGKDEYQRLLDIIEDLKNKLIDERKDKLRMELKIREEVAQEFARYCTEKENDCKAFLSHNQEIMEENCEERMQIYKDLMNSMLLINGKDSAKELKTHSDKQEKAQGGESGEQSDGMDLSCMVESLQHNITDIKQQAEMAYGAIVALEEPQITIERLEKQLHEVRAELSQAQEELLCKNTVVTVQENKLNESTQVLQDATEKMALQNKRIQELSQAVEEKDSEISRLLILLNRLEAVTKDSENTIAAIKHEKEQEDLNKTGCAHFSESMEKYVGNRRKRCVENEEEEGPPAKQGPINNNSKDAIDTKKPEEMQPNTLKEKTEILALEEKNKSLEIQLVTLREELEKKKNENEQFSKKTAKLSQELSSSEERVSGLSRELQQQQASCEKIMTELVALRDANKVKKEKIQTLLQEIETSNQTIAEQKSKIKAVEVQIGELSRFDSQCPRTDTDLASQKEITELLEEAHKEAHVNIGQNSSFHCSIASIWELSKQIIRTSSQKSTQIEDLRKQVEQLQRRDLDAEGEKTQLKLKLSETANQMGTFLMERECLLKQLRDLRQENVVYTEKYREEETRALGFLEQIKEKDGLLDEFRAKAAKATCLEQVMKDKQSDILIMEKEMQDMKEKLNVSESKVRQLNDQEIHLKAEILELRSKLRTTDLQEKEMEKSKQTIERLNTKLSESTALVSDLQKKIQQKDEEYTDLKEKLADAKKQIEQVQREVSSMRAEEKSLRGKVNELEKAKTQLTEELDVKQRTIQHFKKEELNKKLEKVLQQYESACKELCSKEKIIEDMKMTLEEQEQTQAEQDQVLEARLQESERCIAELEEWKKKYHELEKQSSNLRQRNINEECEKSTVLPNKELTSLQEKLKECEEQHKSDRKKWLEEKMLLISQAKEAEMHRNREVKRFAENRELHAKQLEGAEKRLIEKDNDLQKWRTERDRLVTALEAQLNSLISSNTEKDKEIEELKKAVLKVPGKEGEIILEEITNGSTKEIKQTTCENSAAPISPIQAGAEKNKMDDVSDSKQLKEGEIDLPNCSNAEDTGLLTVENTQNQSDTVLDSCEVSSESDRASRFPKPEMEIQFTPLQPNKMEVKHQGSPSMVTIKMAKARKRKSSALDEDFLKSENERNAASPSNMSASCDSLRVEKTALGTSARKDYSLRSKHCVSRRKSPGDTGGTFQKFGSLLQSSPTILQSKAKKFMATLKSSKVAEEKSVRDVKPKRAKRTLHSTDISLPMDFSGHVIVMDQKESDHEIIKRRLRTKKLR
ncbi:kinesin-like protein KIF20B [Pogona vitticeps]